MKKFLILIGALGVLTAPTFAADDPVAVRQALMDSNGASAGVAGGVMKGQLAYSPAVGKAAIQALHATALAYADFFPEGSGDDPKTNASPKIWSDPDGFAAALDKFKTATDSAVQASGKSGPADADAFVAAMKPVLDTCNNCHETYRLKRN